MSEPGRRGALVGLALALAGASACDRNAGRTGVEFVPAAPGDAAATVAAALAQARADHRDLLIYVGATWCEPCQRFHQAAKAGLLDQRFPRLRLLEFDSDRDGVALAAAGYEYHYIPMFARPGSDGRTTGRAIEGSSVKGDGAVAEISARLDQLLK